MEFDQDRFRPAAIHFNHETDMFHIHMPGDYFEIYESKDLEPLVSALKYIGVHMVMVDDYTRFIASLEQDSTVSRFSQLLGHGTPHPEDSELRPLGRLDPNGEEQSQGQ